MVSFEIHTFRDGAWKIDSVFDDKELALSEAQRMEMKNRYGAIRVIEETFNESTNSVSSRTIFRSTKVDAENREATAKHVANAREFKGVRKGSAQKERMIQARKKKIEEARHGTYAGLIFKLGIILIAGISLMMGLRYLNP